MESPEYPIRSVAGAQAWIMGPRQAGGVRCNSWPSILSGSATAATADGRNGRWSLGRSRLRLRPKVVTELFDQGCRRFVSGANRGLGLEMTRELLARGDRVAPRAAIRARALALDAACGRTSGQAACAAARSRRSAFDRRSSRARSAHSISMSISSSTTPACCRRRALRRDRAQVSARQLLGQRRGRVAADPGARCRISPMARRSSISPRRSARSRAPIRSTARATR